MLTFRATEIAGLIGLPAWRVYAGAALLGTIADFGSGPGMRWRATAPDGTKFAATSRPKAAQRLAIHAASRRAESVVAATALPVMLAVSFAGFIATMPVWRLL